MSTERQSFGFDSLLPQNYTSKAEAFAKCLQDKLKSLGGAEEGIEFENDATKRLSEEEEQKSYPFNLSQFTNDHIFVQRPDQLLSFEETHYQPKHNGQFLQKNGGLITDKRGYSSDSEEESDDGKERCHNGTEVIHRRVQELLGQEERRCKLQSMNSEDSWFSCEENEPVHDSDENEELIDHFASQIKGSPRIRNLKARSRKRGNSKAQVATVNHSSSSEEAYQDFDVECFSPVNDLEDAEELLPVNHLDGEDQLILLDGLEVEEYDVPYRILRESSSAGNLEQHFAGARSSAESDTGQFLQPMSGEGLRMSCSPEGYQGLLTPPPSPVAPSSLALADFVLNVRQLEYNLDNSVNNTPVEVDHPPLAEFEGIVMDMSRTRLEGTPEPEVIAKQLEPFTGFKTNVNSWTKEYEAAMDDHPPLSELEEVVMDMSRTTLEERPQLDVIAKPIDPFTGFEMDVNALTKEYEATMEKEEPFVTEETIEPFAEETAIKVEERKALNVISEEVKFAETVANVESTDQVEEIQTGGNEGFCSIFKREGGLVLEIPQHNLLEDVLLLESQVEEFCARMDDAEKTDEDTPTIVEQRTEIDEIFESMTGEQPAESNEVVKTDSKLTVPQEDDDDVDVNPRMKLRRCSSLKTWKTPPGTPGRKKFVRFADALGLDLADVRTFLDEIPKIPSSAYEDLQCELAADPPPPPPTQPTLLPMFQQPGGQMDFLERLKRNFVLLENAVLTDTAVFTITGCVRVVNLGFHKSVHVRYSIDKWQTFSDLQATYVQNSFDGFSDKFSFSLYGHTLKIGEELQFALRFDCNCTQYWDNNAGTNYIFQCLPQAPSNSHFAPITSSIEDEWSKFY